jgi:hypothetical protein
MTAGWCVITVSFLSAALVQHLLHHGAAAGVAADGYQLMYQ